MYHKPVPIQIWGGNKVRVLSPQRWLIQLLVRKLQEIMVISQRQRAEREQREAFWSNTISGKTIYTFVCLPAVVTCPDRLSKCLANKNYLWSASINKTSCFKLSQPKDLEASSIPFIIHWSYYGLEARGYELLLQSLGLQVPTGFCWFFG